jgi:uncharacterized repeat protein (TIGR01451 family)
MAAVVMLLLFLPLAARSSPISFSPAFGQPGNVITITGSGFTGATLVEFNTNTPTLADFTNLSDSVLLVVVPPGAASGAIGVLEGSTWSYSTSNFQVAPIINSFSPPNGANPTVVYILGENFIDNGTTVIFPGVSTRIAATYVASTEVEATVPVGAGDGPLTVITSAGTNVSATNFLASGAPIITSISPSLATNGQMVDIFGYNFFNLQSVKFGTLMAGGYSVVSSTEISATVPIGATSSNVIVSNSYGSATYSNFLTGSGPVITGFSPSVSSISNYVEIYGLDLSAVAEGGSVTFNGHEEDILGSGETNSEMYLEVYLTNDSGTGPIKVMAGTNSFTTSTNFTNSTAPFISSFSPTLGPPGSSVVIDGLNFTGTPSVYFGSTRAASTITGEGTQLTATVPSGLATGNYAIEVTTTAGGATTTSNFTITGTGPVITSFTPTNGVRGTSVTLSGANFTSLGASAVQFNGVTATYQTVTSTTELTATVPADVTSGVITVANSSGTATSPTLFYMQPWITSLSTNGGIVNASFTIAGRSLTGASALQINGLSYTNFTVSATQIVATIPSNATSGQIVITTPGGTFISTNTFAILPKIYSFSPSLGPAGTVVAISGTSLFDVTSVEFGGVSTTDFTATTNAVQVVVPANAASGPLTVVTPYGNDVSTNSFTATHSSTVLLTKTANPIVTGPGTNMTYLLLVTNEGPSIISATVVTDTLPAGFAFVSASAGVGSWVHTNNEVIWTIGTLTNNNTASLDIVGTAPEATALTNNAELAFAEGNLAAYDNYASIVNYFVNNSQRTLSIALQANPREVRISWPLSPANFLLQINTGSNLDAGWTYPTNAVFITNSLNTFTDSLTAPWTFFRLAPP